ncbi:unnamed protein product [Pleuronectes platessa]|uniref:Uncharacterized protein n=1 Tax=Pleuronectes platessa TaxID=8262 RepID=A0A9N7YZJ7_PLEPL|nr:unnamed protein product [Pleuronectes platessa]
MDNKSKKTPGRPLRASEKKLKSWRWRLPKCAKLTDLFWCRVSPAQQQQVRRETSEEDSTMMSGVRQTWCRSKEKTKAETHALEAALDLQLEASPKGQAQGDAPASSTCVCEHNSSGSQTVKWST